MVWQKHFTPYLIVKFQVCPVADGNLAQPSIHWERLTVKQHVQWERVLHVRKWFCRLYIMLDCPLGGVGRSGTPGGLPQLPGVPAVGVHTSGHCLHPAVPYCDPSVPLHTLPACVQAQEPAQGGLFQQPVGWRKENLGYAVGWTRSHMAW